MEARRWRQPKYPSTDEWISKMWYICTMEYYSAIERITSIFYMLHMLHVCYTCYNMDEPSFIMLNERSQDHTLHDSIYIRCPE